MKTTIQQTAYFYHNPECGFKAQLIIDLDYISIMTTITNNVTAKPNIRIERYKSKKKAYKKYLYKLGEALSGHWEFDKFTYNRELTINE